MHKIHGMIVPLVTPLTLAGEVDVSRLRSLCEIQIKAGIDVLFILGTTGEFYGLTSKQRRVVTDITLETVKGRIPVLAGVSGDSTASALVALADCRRDGVAGYVAGTPYFLNYNQNEIADFYSSLSDAVGRPLVLYNFPFRYRNTIELGTINNLLSKNKAFAIKDVSGDLEYMRGLLDLKKNYPDFLVFEGALPNLGKSAPLGIDGSVQALGNLLPDECADIWSDIRNKNWLEAEKKVDTMWEFHQKLETAAVFIAAAKGCMSLRGWCESLPARPTRPVDERAMKKLEALMDRYYPDWRTP
jgi:dihydrodipicolinate synthase/N-acetylneuraminate lyase